MGKVQRAGEAGYKFQGFTNSDGRKEDLSVGIWNIPILLARYIQKPMRSREMGETHVAANGQDRYY